MTLHLDALRRDITRRLCISSPDEVKVMDLLLTELELSRTARREPPLFNIAEGSTEADRGYRRGWNDAMRASDAQSMVWRARAILVTRASDVERGLAELAERAPAMEGVVEFDLSDGGE